MRGVKKTLLSAQCINRRFLLTYMSYFLLALLLTALLHSAATKVIERYAVDSALSLLEQGRNAIDFQLEQAVGIADHFAQDRNVQSFLNVSKPLRDADYNALRELFTSLPYADLNNSIIHRLFIYYPNSDVILSPSLASGRVETVYNHYLAYEGMDYIAWREQILSGLGYSTLWPSRNVTVEGTSISAITYIQGIFRLYHIDTQGYVIAMIDEDKLAASLDNSLIREGGASYIIDAQGNRIAGIGYGPVAQMEPDLADLAQWGRLPANQETGELLVIQTLSPANGWRYVSILPKDALMRPVHSVTRTFLWTLAAGFMLWGLASLMMARRNSRPILDIVRLLSATSDKQETPVGNEFDFIRGTIANLINANESLTADMRQQQTLVRNAFLDRLLQNRFVDEREIQHHMEYARIAFAGPWLQVAVIRIHGYFGQMTSEMLEDMDKVLVLVRRLLAEQWEDTAHSHQMDNGDLAVLLSAAGPFETEAELGKFHQTLTHYNIAVTIGVGRRYDTAENAWRSFNEARLALDLPGARQPIHKFDESSHSSDDYSYPMQTEVRLANLIKLGESAGVKELLQGLRTDNFEKRHLTLEKARLLISELTGTAAKLKDDLAQAGSDAIEHAQAEIESICASPPGCDAFDRACALLLSFSDLVAERHELRRRDLRDEMLRFIREHYDDPDLCLYSMAKEFNLVEKYFSRFFKEQTGENFSACLERTRMERARTLLDEGNAGVSQIAQSVGYVNINTFYKAFKRTFGVSPRAIKTEHSILRFHYKPACFV